eukprot:48604-Hanusia_phi.AAC.1
MVRVSRRGARLAQKSPLPVSGTERGPGRGSEQWRPGPAAGARARRPAAWMPTGPEPRITQ